MRWAGFFVSCWMLGPLSAQVAPQEEVTVAVIDKPVQIFLHPVTTEGVRAEFGSDPETSAFLLEAVRATYEADLARILTQHVAPTRLIDRKTKAVAPGWEIRARITEVKRPGVAGRLGLATTLEIVDLRTTRLLMTMNIRSGLEEGGVLAAVDDDPEVTPWNPPPPRLRKRGVPDELVDGVQADTTLAVRQAVYRLAANIRQGR